MKHIKKTLFLLPLLLLASCNFKYQYIIEGLDMGGMEADTEDDDIDDRGSYNIKVWVDNKVVNQTRTQIASFVSESGGKYTINANVEDVSESNAAALMIQDVQNGADIFIFAQDQLSRLKVTGAIAKQTGSYADFIRNSNSEESVAAASLGDSIYAYPTTSDNGYFLYYDKRILSDDDVKDMSKLLAKLKEHNASGNRDRLYFKAQSDGFYGASYFLATGCHSNWDIDEESGKFLRYDDNINSDAGLAAAKGLKELTDRSLVVSSSNSAASLNEGAAAVVSGIWDYQVAVRQLGDNLGCADLPSFTVDGQTYHLSSFDGYKLMGVKPQVDAKKASVCRKLAKYLTGETCQSQRFDELSWGPTNKAVAQKDKVKNHPGLAALAKQHVYATQQSQCPGAWFNALKVLSSDIKENSTDEQIRTYLAKYEAGLRDLLDEDQEVKE